MSGGRGVKSTIRVSSAQRHGQSSACLACPATRPPHLQAAQLAGACHAAERSPEGIVTARRVAGGEQCFIRAFASAVTPRCLAAPRRSYLGGSGMAASDAGSAMSPGCSLPCCAAAERQAYTEKTCGSAGRVAYDGILAAAGARAQARRRAPQRALPARQRTGTTAQEVHLEADLLRHRLPKLSRVARAGRVRRSHGGLRHRGGGRHL